MMRQLEGKKTYIVAAVAGLVTIVYAMGLIDSDMANKAYAALGAAGLATLRAGIDK